MTQQMTPALEEALDELVEAKRAYNEALRDHENTMSWDTDKLKHTNYDVDDLKKYSAKHLERCLSVLEEKQKQFDAVLESVCS